MADVPRVVYVAANAEQAHLLAGALRDRDFGAIVTHDRLQLGLGALPFGLSTAPRVVVPESEAPEARRIVLELVGETPETHGPIQFRLRTVLWVLTALCVYFAIDRVTGWQLSAFVPLILNSIMGIVLLVVGVLVVRRKWLERRGNAEV